MKIPKGVESFSFSSCYPPHLVMKVWIKELILFILPSYTNIHTEGDGGILQLYAIVDS